MLQEEPIRSKGKLGCSSKVTNWLSSCEPLEPPKPTNAKGSIDLEQENRQLKEARICKNCMENESGVVFLPCGHLICCVQCAPSLKDCPLCRQPIHGTVKTYMS